MRRTGLAVTVAVAFAVTLGSCRSSAPPSAHRIPVKTPDSPLPTGTRDPTVDRYATVVAQARSAAVRVFSSPGDPIPRSRVRSTDGGGPLVFVVLETEGQWLHALLPVRPNGSSGWIRRADVRLSQHDYRIVVELARHRITVYEGASIVDRESVGVGKAQTPTPGGLYYTTQLLKPDDPHGIYGPFAYQLSGFSSVLTRFNGGTGVIGIHGTNEPWLIGKDVSHGCIRMSNAGITRLARLLPLGVPVEIRP